MSCSPLPTYTCIVVEEYLYRHDRRINVYTDSKMASFKESTTPRTSRSPPPQKRFTHAQKRFIHAVDYFSFTLSWRTIGPDDPDDHTSGCIVVPYTNRSPIIRTLQ